MYKNSYFITEFKDWLYDLRIVQLEQISFQRAFEGWCGGLLSDRKRERVPCFRVSEAKCAHTKLLCVNRRNFESEMIRGRAKSSARSVDRQKVCKIDIHTYQGISTYASSNFKSEAVQKSAACYEYHLYCWNIQ